MALQSGDTIAALSTAAGPAAIAVIRLSGPDALRIAADCFRGKTRVDAAEERRVLHGWIIDEAGERIDEVVVTAYHAPRSYTGEDLVEISGHGSGVVAGAILDALCRRGARLAAPGEFTRRAFLNGKIDLSQAEAVMEMVSVQSRSSARVALTQLEGKLGRAVGELRRSLIDLCALLELELDFAEESLELIGREETRRRLEMAAKQIEDLVASYRDGKRIREGISVVLTGKPNAGKSSLFNALLREARAIVTPIPGTTRDTLEETIELKGYLFKLSDTAGIRETSDLIEREGVERTLKAKQGADTVLIVEDPADPVSEEEFTEFVGSLAEEQAVLRVINKCDLLDEQAKLKASSFGTARCPVVLLSAKTGWGLENLEKILCRMVAEEKAGHMPVFLINQRHHELFRRAGETMRNALRNWEKFPSNELAAVDVREAANCLAEITGDITSEDILNSIFSRFCIGK